MAWIVLILSGLMEAVWATALGKSEGLSRIEPSIVFLIGLALSMAGLAFSMRSIPIGTAYAVWVGIGAVVTVAWAMVSGDEPVSLVRIALLGGIVACVVGLRLAE